MPKHDEAGLALVDELSFDQAFENAEATIATNFVALRAREKNELDRLALHLFGEPLPNQITVLVVRRANLGNDIGLGVDARIHHHDLDAGLGGGVGRGDQTFRIARIEDQKLNALRDHVLDVGDLLRHVVLTVGLRDLATRFLGLVDRGRDLRGEIGGAERVHGDADLAVGRLGRAVGAGCESDRKRNRRKGCLH